MDREDLKKGIKDGLPIVIGYAPIAITFGLVSKTYGISLFETFSFSLFVFAGASQFMALNLIALGGGILGIVITTFLVNLRHFLMSSALSKNMEERCNKLIPLIAWGVTDESFAIASLHNKKISPEYMLALNFTCHIAWFGFAIVGYELGEFLPKTISLSMGIALYAMFISMLVPQMKKSFAVTVIVLFSGFINFLVKYINILPKGWSIIIAIVVASYLGSFLIEREEKL